MSRFGRALLSALVALAATVMVGVSAPAAAATGWTMVSSGAYHTCGIRAGRVYCWGSNDSGQLGIGTLGGSTPVPTLIKSVATDWTSVSAGGSHTCAIRIGRVACWGLDSYGQLGDGSPIGPRAVPAFIASTATDWKSVSAGSQHTCAIRIGRIACWGLDNHGQLGDRTIGGSRTYPAFIASTATDWKSVSAGEAHNCAIRIGRVACWGESDEDGSLGDGVILRDRAYPAFIVSSASDWTSVSAGNHTCAIRAGRIYCWGNDDFGQLADGEIGDNWNGTSFDRRPTPITSRATDWKSVSVGGDHTCAVRVGRVACWGYDVDGQLGDGVASGQEPDQTPNFIASSAPDWKSVGVGGRHTCGIHGTSLACWGGDSYGQLGDGALTDAPDPIPNDEVS